MRLAASAILRPGIIARTPVTLRTHQPGDALSGFLALGFIYTFSILLALLLAALAGLPVPPSPQKIGRHHIDQ